MKAQPNLMSLEQASETVRIFSGDYPVCIITSPKGAEILKPILEGCSYIINGTEMVLLEDDGCKDNAVYFLPKADFDKFMKASGRDS